jgi:hypothetical protein
MQYRNIEWQELFLLQSATCGVGVYDGSADADWCAR